MEENIQSNNLVENQAVENAAQNFENAQNQGEETSKKSGGFFKKSSKEEKLKAENTELRNDLQRTRADFENFRKNVETRVAHAQALGEKKAILALLPMIDDIERAISHLPTDLAENAWAQNVVKMATNLDKNLSKIGVEKIDSKAGAIFDPEIHHAIQIDEDAEGDEEIVAEQLQAGYKIRGEVLRTAMVKVGRK